MSFDALFYREFDFERYNCLHFTVEVWQTLFGIDLSYFTTAITQDSGRQNMHDAYPIVRMFRRLRRPASPCLCLMRRLMADETHIATYLDGRVLHLNELGVQYLPPDAILPQYKQVVFYEHRHHH